MKRPTSSTKGMSLKTWASLGLGGISALATSGCTGQIPNSFRFLQQNQEFAASIDINTKIDLLWVIDNSASMNAQQDKLRQGIAGFAAKYMQPTWDIEVAVITTDMYMANPAFSNYLSSTISGTVGASVGTYIPSRTKSWNNPASNPTFVNTSSWTFTNGVTFNDLVPSWGSNYSKLIAGIHDGPIAGMCFEGMPYSLNATPNCRTRDQSNYADTSHCLNPTGGENAIQQCINTTQNNTVHSGKAIIKTMPVLPLTGAALTTWTNQLIDDFKVNATVGITGAGSERGLASVLQVITDNEGSSSTSKFFREGSLRGIIFVTDEEDQSMTIATGTQVAPFDHYMCDQASLVALNPSGNITGVNGYCCSTPGNNCKYGSNGTSCSATAKTIDGTSYKVSLCPDPAYLMPVADVKTQLDNFFMGLDGTTTPNYFITTITPLTMASINLLKPLHDADDTAAGAFKNYAVNRGDRYIDLGNLVGNGSMSLDITAADYSPLLDSIGQAIIDQKSSFPLSRIPTGSEDMIVTLIHADGSSTVIPSSKYTIVGNTVKITDTTLVLSFTATDKLTVNYQPKYVNQ